MQLNFFQIEHGHSMPEGKIRDFCDGSLLNKHPLFFFLLNSRKNTVLRSMQLVAICPSQYLNQYGFDKVLHRFMVEINMLESVSIIFNVH